MWDARCEVVSAVMAEEPSGRRRWAMLAISTTAQSASSLFANGAAFLIPFLHDQRHLSLARAGVLVAMPTLGFVLTLIAWGALGRPGR